MIRCHDGSTFVQSAGRWHTVRCVRCRRVLATVEGPRDEVYADL